MYDIWTEKYRPEEFGEIVGQENIVERVKSFVETKELPHLLFAGPAGSGKSSLTLVIARKMFGNTWKQNFLELNASDSRGIDVVRTRIKDFARTKSIGGMPYKICFLDESDALTSEAQNALRRTMENYSDICRFILSCNYSSKIIEPIQSRCAVFKFRRLSENDVKKRVEHIAKKEKVNISDDALKAIYELSEGDMRKAINLLQVAATNSKSIKEKTIYEVASLAEPKEIRKMVDYALEGKFIDSRKVLRYLLLENGVSGQDIIKQISNLVYDLNVSDKIRIELIERIGEFEFRIDQGGNDQIQLEALLAQLALLKGKQ